MKRLLRDNLEVFLLKGWKQTDKENIGVIEDAVIPVILKIQSEAFPNQTEKDIFRHSKRSGKIFYVIKDQGEVVGYCIYYLKPIISSRVFKKQAIIYSIAIDKNFRGKCFGKRLLQDSIEEMKLNGVSSIFLYVNQNNNYAIQLYEKTGFIITEQVEGVCGQNQKCYKMELKLI
jgi:ribosomal-protein-alanine N-acetyltransferase